MTFTPPRQKLQVDLVGPAYSVLSSNANAQTCINWYPVSIGSGGKSSKALYPTPGTTLIQSIGSGPHRGAIEFKDKAYFVSGGQLIDMDSGENTTTIGNLLTTTGGVVMATNEDFGDQVLIVDGTEGYIFDGVTIAAIADADFPANPTSCDYLDGRYIVTVADSGVFYISDLNDGTAWTATQFANAERDSDNLMRVIANNRDLMLLGERSMEVWVNTGASPFPFEPYPNGIIDVGCAARLSAAKAMDTVIWLTEDRRGTRQIVQCQGTSYKAISNHALEYQLSTYSTVSDATAFTYAEYGMTFYQISFPHAGVTWVCNLSADTPEDAWFQKQTDGGRHIASTYVYFNGKHYVGAHDSSNLYTMDSGVYLDDTDAIVRERTSGVVHAATRNRVRHISLEIEFEAGVGLVTGQGSNPQVALTWSDDGGHTWSNARTTSIGAIGDYSARALFHQLGQARDRIYKVRVSDPVKYVLISAYLDMEELLH